MTNQVTDRYIDFSGVTKIGPDPDTAEILKRILSQNEAILRQNEAILELLKPPKISSFLGHEPVELVSTEDAAKRAAAIRASERFAAAFGLKGRDDETR